MSTTPDPGVEASISIGGPRLPAEMVSSMGSPGFAVELTTVQGAAVRFGPYEQDDAQRLAAEFAPRIGRDDVVFSATIDRSGRAIGAWSMAGNGIAAVRVVPCSTRPSGRLQRPTWSRA